MQSTSAVERRDKEPAGLSDRNRRIVAAVAQALLCDADSSGQLVAPDPRLVERVVADLAQMLAQGSTDLRRGYWVLCNLIEALPLVVVRSLRRMSKMDLEDRVAYLEAVEASRTGLITTLLAAFKIPIMIVAHESGEELAGTGYPRPTLSTPRGPVPIAAPSGAIAALERTTS